MPAKCKEINQGLAPSVPSHHHICFQAAAFKLQKACVESDVKAVEAQLNLMHESPVWCLVGQKC